MRNLFVAMSMLLTALLPFSTRAQQIAKGLTASNGVFIGFYEYKPTNYNTNTKYPVIIFLHGIGERGDGTTQLSRVLANGVPNNINNGHNMTFTWNGKTETFLVLSPQLSEKYGNWQNFYVDEMIKYAKNNLSIDTDRIYLTGLSLGGGGVWNYAASTLTNAQTLAAIGVSCGTCQNVDWCNIAKGKLPVWAFHAQDDGTVGVGCTTGTVAAINKCNPEVKPYMTIWPDGQHWIWGRVFDTEYTWQNPNIYEYFLGHKRNTPINKLPVANAGADITVSTLLGTVNLTAGASYDPDGQIVRTIWRKISGPSFGNIVLPVSINGITAITGLALAGTYQYELKVVDNNADWSLDTVTVTVNSLPLPSPATNQSPVANAGGSSNITLPTNSATLNGGASSDADGSIRAYAWTKINGPSQYTIANAAAATTDVSNLTEGTYQFQLTVTDNDGASSSATTTVTVNPAVTAPRPSPASANAGSDISITLPVSSTTLSGSGTGTIQAYKWTKVSGPTSYTIANPTSASTALSNLVQGTYNFQLTIWDQDWTPYSDNVIVTVNAGTAAPVAVAIPNAGGDVTITLPANTATLNGSGSTDPNGPIQAYQWTKIAGPSSYSIANISAATTTVTSLTAGTYSFRLTIWDNAWVPRSDTMKLTVNPAPANAGGGGGGSIPPTNNIANAGADIYLTLPSNSCVLNGSASADPNGQIKAYQWTSIGGPAQYTIASPRSASTSLGNLVTGIYTFQLTIWDHDWIPRADTVVVTVSGGSTAPVAVQANAGPDIYLVLPTNSTSLNASASYDPNGGIIKAYQWTKISGPSQYTLTNTGSAIASLSNLAEGVYSFRLITWDNNWVPRADTVSVIVSNSAAARMITQASAAKMATTVTPETRVAAALPPAAVADGLKVYPNPVQSSLTLQLNSKEQGATIISLYDVSGKLIRKISTVKAQSLLQQNLQVADLRAGVYHLEVTIDQKTRLITKFIKL